MIRRSWFERGTFPQLLFVDGNGVLREPAEESRNPDNPLLAHVPYGAMLLRDADREGNAVIVFKHPAVEDRDDVLVIERPARLRIVSPLLEDSADPRDGCRSSSRARIALHRLEPGVGGPPACGVVVRIQLPDQPSGRELTSSAKNLLKALCYSIRVNDRPGWFDHEPAGFPIDAFRHGHPDIATREQGPAGIRGPSRLGAGLHRAMRMARFAPRRERSLEPGERVIYELHIGTFTVEGTFSAAGRHLPRLRKLGFTTLQLMPLDISGGSPGWTYDQTRTGAVDDAYGGAEGLIGFVERAHALGLEVIVDKQYNHEGPEQDSRSQIVPGMFTRGTKWGSGLSGKEAPCYAQVVALLAEEMAYWVTQFGVDGYRFDATNRLPWEIHERLATAGREIEHAVGKSLYLLSEYAECEEPVGRRTPTGHQFADQPGRYVMKLLRLSNASHVTRLPTDGGSTLRAMLKAARRGWWYPDVPSPPDGLSGGERSATLLWNHDWIGNRFGGERIHHLISLQLFKTLAVWQALGQWVPLVFMGTERYARTPWYFFSGHRDAETRNHTSCYYTEAADTPLLRGGRFHEFSPEAEAAGLREALAFSEDGTVAGIQWEVFRNQTDRRGKPYMDHARQETFTASKLDWRHADSEQQAIETLFAKIMRLRTDPRVKEVQPEHSQYKAWDGEEFVFVLRRRATDGSEYVALFNLGPRAVEVTISPGGIEARECGVGYVVSLEEGTSEDEWSSAGRYALWLDTNQERYGGTDPTLSQRFHVANAAKTIRLPHETAMLFSKR